MPWHLLHVCLLQRASAPHETHRTAARPIDDKLDAGAAAAPCDRACEASTNNGGLANVKPWPSRMALSLAARAHMLERMSKFIKKGKRKKVQAERKKKKETPITTNREESTIFLPPHGKPNPKYNGSIVVPQQHAQELHT